MANFATLKAAINAVIKTNGNKEITGEVLNQVLNAMVTSLGANYQFAGVATPSTNPGTPDQNVFYMATEAGTYTNFNATVLPAGISILLWNGSWSHQTFFEIDSVPTSGSDNFITSGAVFEKMKLDGGAYDVSAHNGGATFASLSALLSSDNLNTLIPVDIRHGGMSIKFVQSSDNKYVQFRYMGNAVTGTPNPFLDIDNWQGVEKELAFESDNIPTSGTTKEYIDKKTDDFIQIGIEDTVVPAINVNKWTLSLTPYDGRFVAVNAGDKLRIKANSSFNTVYAILSSRSYVLGGNVSFATGYTSTVTLLAGNVSNVIEVPNDGVVLYVYAYANNDNHLPEYIKKKNTTREVVLFSDISNNVNEGGSNKPTSAEVAKYLNIKIDNVAGVVGNIEVANYDNELFPAISVNKWTLAKNAYNGKIVNVIAGEKYRITGNKNSDSYYTVLSSTSYVLGGNVSFATGWGQEIINKDLSTDFFTIPSDGVAIWVSNIYDGVDKLPIVESSSIDAGLSLSGTVNNILLELKMLDGVSQFDSSIFSVKNTNIAASTGKSGMTEYDWRITPYISVKEGDRIRVVCASPLTASAAIAIYSGDNENSFVRSIAHANDVYSYETVIEDGEAFVRFCNNFVLFQNPSAIITSEDTNIQPSVRLENIESSIDAINDKIDNAEVERFILSEGLKEKMSHSAHVFYYKGVFYNYYMCGEVNTVESVWDATEFLRLAKMSSLRLDGNAQIEDLYKDGEGLGDFHQSPNYPVVIANAMVKDNILFTYMRLRSSESESVAIIAYRRFNLDTNSWIDSVPAICKLDGNDFNGPNTANSYVSVGGSTPNSGNASNEISIILASDGYYYQMIGVGSYGYGLLIRSSDLINWESVAVNQGLIDLFGEGGSFYSFENEVAELTNGVLAVACRVEGKGNVYYTTYDITNDEWSVPVVVPNTILTKPRMFHYKNKLYLNVNLNKSITTPNYGTQNRATLGIFEVSSEGVTLVKVLENRTGIHYTWTTTDFDDNLYLCFSEDRRYLDASQGRSDIGVTRLVI